MLIAPPADGDDESIVISAISVGELHAGVELARDDATRSARLARLTALVASVPVLAVDGSVAARYGELRRASGRAPSNDLWIAATALAHDLTLLTRDVASLPSRWLACATYADRVPAGGGRLAPTRRERRSARSRRRVASRRAARR